ncbi:MAG: hypothetical protein CM15mV38_1350 [uncultured marine virus]|nr:MAG: hypothetical protein CM15mV38_1350 [uncultured marine virus]
MLDESPKSKYNFSPKKERKSQCICDPHSQNSLWEFLKNEYTVDEENPYYFFELKDTK